MMSDVQTRPKEGARRTRKDEIAVVDENAVAILAELANVKVGDGRPELSEANELGAVKSNRVVDRSRAVDDPVRESQVRIECWNSLIRRT